MNFFAKEFVSTEHKAHGMLHGGMIASALAGFVAGAAVATIIFLTGIAFSINFFQ